MYGGVVIVSGVDRLPWPMANFRASASDMQCAGAVLRPLAEPVVYTLSGLAESVLAALGVAAKLEGGCVLQRAACGRSPARANGMNFTRKWVDTGEAQRGVNRIYNFNRVAISRLAA